VGHVQPAAARLQVSGDLVLVCRACNVPLTRSLREMSNEEWRAEEWRVHSTNAPMIEPDRVLLWSHELWSQATEGLPFASDCYVLAPEAFIVTGWVSSKMGCCGFPPAPPIDGLSPRNQMCVCGELVGWHNTDCLLPHYVALAPSSVTPSGT